MKMAHNPKNWIVLVGKVVSIKFSHYSAQQKKWYKVIVQVNRKTDGKYDNLPVLVPAWALNEKNVRYGDSVKIEGQVRSYTNHEGGWQKRHIMVYSRNLEVVSNETEHENQVHLEGDVYRVMVKRTTPVSNRRVVDFSVNVERNVEPRWSDCIYCIAWGKEADAVELLTNGCKVEVDGRMQSRNFTKKHPDGSVTSEVVYEISAFTVD